MNEMTCPWCESELVPAAVEAQLQTCPECNTTWQYEDEPTELALAA